MNLTLKVRDFSKKQLILGELTKLSISYNNPEPEGSNFLFKCLIKNPSLTIHGEPEYELVGDIILKLDPESTELTLDEMTVNSSDFFLDLLDDLIFEELSNKELYQLKNRAADINWADFENKIKEEPSLDSFYHKVKHDKTNWIGTSKNIALYKILLHSERIVDIDNLYDFLDNYFEIRFADLILKYHISEPYLTRILSNPNLNPVVHAEYMDKYSQLEPLANIIKTATAEELANYYFKLIKKGEKNISTEVMLLLNNQKTPAEVIESISREFEMCFIYNKVLPHPNCPSRLLEAYAMIPAYGVSILSNPNVPSFLIDKMANHSLEYDNSDKLIELFMSHPNTLQVTKDIISKRKATLASYESDLSMKNLQSMLKDSAKFNLQQILRYAKLLKEHNLASQDEIDVIELSIKEAQSILNKKVNIKEIIKQYPDWDPDKTKEMIMNLDEGTCTELAREEITSGKLDSTLLTEISKKYEKLASSFCRNEVMIQLSTKAKSNKGLELAKEILNDKAYINQSFKLNLDEKNELIQELINNPQISSDIKSKLSKVS